MPENVAEDQAKQASVENQASQPSANIYTTVEEMLIDYKRETLHLSTGKTFEIESLIPETLLINIGSPIVQQFIVEPNTLTAEDRIPVSPNQAERITDEMKRIICQHIISVTISMLPQAFCGDNVLSIDRLTPTEIRELFHGIIKLSTGEAVTFQRTEQSDPEQPGNI